MKTSLLTAVSVLALVTQVSLAQDANVRLEGSGSRRDALNATHLQPFPTALWSELTNWTNGEAPTPESTKGKVVLVLTWSSFHQVSQQAARLAQSLSDKFGPKGLVVVGVHNPRGFEGAAAKATELGVKFAFASDEKGKFRDGLRVDQDPDFYIIDRAGNMRFADADTAAVDGAVSQLIAESEAQAAAKPSDVTSARTQADVDRRKTGNITGVVRPGEAPMVNFELPDADAYKVPGWFRLEAKTGLQVWDQAAEKINKEPPTLTLPDTRWVPGQPNTKGKLVVLYIIEPTIRDMLNVLTIMNRVQDVYLRDAVVIGNFGQYDPSKANNTDPREVAEYQRRVERVVASVEKNRQINHSLLVGNIQSDFFQNIPVVGRSIDEIAVCFILSTDGTIRWMGHPSEDSFKFGMQKMINIDPGVKARRAAEDAAAK